MDDDFRRELERIIEEMKNLPNIKPLSKLIKRIDLLIFNKNIKPKTEEEKSLYIWLRYYYNSTLFSQKQHFKISRHDTILYIFKFFIKKTKSFV